jgi:Ricin-type beta-trefoil lectin domain-like
VKGRSLTVLALIILAGGLAPAAAQAQTANRRPSVTSVGFQLKRASIARVDSLDGPSWIEFESSNKCADDPGYSTGNVRIDQWSCVNQTNEYWYLDFSGGSGPLVVNGASGKCLNVSGASKSSGAFVIQYPCSNALNNQWTVLDVLVNGQPIGDELMNVNSGLCLNVAGNSKSNGADLIQYTCGYYLNEIFYTPSW